AICGTVSGPRSARLRMKPNAPPPQLVMNPVFWPTARILKKHWATSSISSAIASALVSTIGPAPVLGAVLVLCRADVIASVLQVDTMVVNLQNDTIVVIYGSRHVQGPDWTRRLGDDRPDCVQRLGGRALLVRADSYTPGGQRCRTDAPSVRELGMGPGHCA